ncbi:MAG: hypothetical protein ACI4NB_03745 [Candidatus Ornithospirochaeta sp.]
MALSFIKLIFKGSDGYFLDYKKRAYIFNNDLEKTGIFAYLLEASSFIQNEEDGTKDACFSLSPDSETLNQLLDIARIPEDKKKKAIEVLESAKDKGFLEKVGDNPPLYAFPNVLDSVNSYKRKSLVNKENGSKGGRQKAKATAEALQTGEIKSTFYESPFSFPTKNGVETISEEQISSFQREFPSVDIRESLERFKTWCEKGERDFSKGVDYFLRNTWFKNPPHKAQERRNNQSSEFINGIVTEEAGI